MTPNREMSPLEMMDRLTEKEIRDRMGKLSGELRFLRSLLTIRLRRDGKATPWTRKHAPDSSEPAPPGQD